MKLVQLYMEESLVEGLDILVKLKLYPHRDVHLCLSCHHIFTTARRKTKCKCGGELRVIDTYKGKVRRIDRKHYILKTGKVC